MGGGANTEANAMTSAIPRFPHARSPMRSLKIPIADVLVGRRRVRRSAGGSFSLKEGETDRFFFTQEGAADKKPRPMHQVVSHKSKTRLTVGKTPTSGGRTALRNNQPH